ncbi:hypothetical protein AB0I28_12505 [Phytomonospora sp. NPDC050363]|uniref:hypothetical protein n=1 Tax=Phytomonospora sp. NPDC050363 TaxID=3155642 RepID=UPI0033CE86E4
MSYAETRDAAMNATLAAIDETVTEYVTWHGSCDSATWYADERGDDPSDDEEGPWIAPEVWEQAIAHPPLVEWPAGTTILGLCHAVLDAADGPIPVLAEVTIRNNPGQLAEWSATARVPLEHTNRALDIPAGNPIRLRVALGEESLIGEVHMCAWECTSGDSHALLEMRAAGPVERIRADLSIYDAHGVEPPEEALIPQRLLDGIAANNSADALREYHRPRMERIQQFAVQAMVEWEASLHAMQVAINTTSGQVQAVGRSESTIHSSRQTAPLDPMAAWLTHYHRLVAHLADWEQAVNRVRALLPPHEAGEVEQVANDHEWTLRRLEEVAGRLMEGEPWGRVTARERALQARQSRNTGPTVRRRNPRRIDPRGTR